MPRRGLLNIIRVDGHASVLEEQAERRPTVEGATEGLRQVALAGDAGELLLRPDPEGRDLRRADPLTCRTALVRGPPGDFALDIVECTDAVERLAGDLRFGCRPDVVEVASQVRPAGGLDERPAAVGVLLVEPAEACRHRPGERRCCSRDAGAGARPFDPVRSRRPRRAARRPTRAAGRAHRPRCGPACRRGPVPHSGGLGRAPGSACRRHAADRRPPRRPRSARSPDATPSSPGRGRRCARSSLRPVHWTARSLRDRSSPNRPAWCRECRPPCARRSPSAGGAGRDRRTSRRGRARAGPAPPCCPGSAGSEQAAAPSSRSAGRTSWVVRPR